MLDCETTNVVCSVWSIFSDFEVVQFDMKIKTWRDFDKGRETWRE